MALSAFAAISPNDATIIETLTGNDHAHKHNSTVYIIYPFYLFITITNDFAVVYIYDYELGIVVKPNTIN